MSEVPPRYQDDSVPLPKQAAEQRAVYCENSQEGGTLILHSNRLVRDLISPGRRTTVLSSAVGALVEEHFHYRPTLVLGVVLLAAAASAGGYTGANQVLLGPANAHAQYVIEGIAFFIGAVLAILRWKRWRYVLKSPSGYIWMEWTVVGRDPEWTSALRQWVTDIGSKPLE